MLSVFTQPFDSVVNILCSFLLLCCTYIVGRNRQSGEHNNSSEKDNKNEGTVTNNDRNAGESGRGRGSREDRWSDRKPGGRGAEHLVGMLKDDCAIVP